MAEKQSAPEKHLAPGSPGIAPTWCSSAKDVVTTALGSSRVWATLGYGILNEVYWPSTGNPQIRDLGFIVAAPDGRWTEVKRMNSYQISTPQPDVPVPTVVHRADDFQLTLRVVVDDIRDCVLIDYDLRGDGHQLYVLLTPRLGSEGRNNTAWFDRGAFYGARDDACLCLRAGCGFHRQSVGYVGHSDGWQDFHENGAMTWQYDRAESGNVAVTGELAAPQGTLALSFDPSPRGAETLSRASLAEGFETLSRRVVQQWVDRGTQCERLPGEMLPESSPEVMAQVRRSNAVLQVCDDRHYPGAVVGSLSIPWGNARDDLGGYHLVWARDSVEVGLGMLAVGHFEAARRLAAYLIATQQADGHWAQDFYPAGKTYSKGTQLDEVALPVMLVAKLQECGQLGNLQGTEDLVRSALGFLARQGPVTPEDRWEENAGINAYTLAVVIAAMVAGSEFLSDPSAQRYALSYADYLNRRIEDWLYVENVGYAKQAGVGGYYLRIATPDIFTGRHGTIPIAYREGQVPVEEVVSLDFTYLVRLGLRDAGDQRIQNTLKVVDGQLRGETPNGPAYYRYPQDAYGEHADGSPFLFDSGGLGRLWPLLSGERGHMAVLADEDPSPYLKAMCRMTSKGGLLPEQVWDTDAIPAKHLYPGCPTGSVMPLVWAHSELIKLAKTCQDRRPVELLDSVAQRYCFERPDAGTWHWRRAAPFVQLPAGKDMLVEDTRPFMVNVSFDGRANGEQHESSPLAFGMHGVRLSSQTLRGHRELKLEFLDQPQNEREYRVEIARPRA